MHECGPKEGWITAPRHCFCTLRRSRILAGAAAITLSGLWTGFVGEGTPAFGGTVSWGVNGSGAWATASNWLDDLNVQRLPGLADDVLIDRPTGTYTVTHSSGTDTVNSITSNESLTISNSTLSTVASAQINGALTINAGAFGGGNWTLAGGGTLTAATLSGNVTVASGPALNVAGGFVLSNGTFSITGGTDVQVHLNGTETISGSGAVSFDNPTKTGLIDQTTSGTITFGPNITVQTGSGSGTVGASTLTSIVNQGTFSARTAGKLLSLSGGTFSNTGTLEAKNGGTLAIGGTITNLGTFNSTGGTININGNIVNTGKVLALDGVGNSLSLAGGTVTNGTLSTTNGAVLSIPSGTFSGLTLASDLTVNSAYNLNVINGLTLTNSALSINAGSSAHVHINGTQTISGTGTISFDDPASAGLIDQTTSGTITFGPNITVQTGAGSGTIGASSVTNIVNQGTISARTAGKTLSIGYGTFSNSGLLEAKNGGTLLIGGSISSLGTFDSTGGTIGINGTVTNTGKTLALNGVGNSVSLVGGTISNGSLSTTNGAVLTVTSGSFLGLTLLSDLTIGSGANLNVISGLTLSGSTISIAAGGNAHVHINGSQTVGGTGTISFDDATTTGVIDQTSSGTVTFGPNVLIRTGTGSGVIGASAVTNVINQGTISAQTAGKTISFGVGTFTNVGTLEARNGGTLTAPTPSNFAAGNLTGGTWNVYAGSTMRVPINVTANGGSITLDGIGSNFYNSTSGTVSVLANLTTNSGTFTITNGRSFSTAGAFSNSGTLVIGPSSTFESTGLLTNTGLTDLTIGTLKLDRGVASPSSVVAQLHAAYKDGSWTGSTGITSSAAAADPHHSLGIGYSLSGSIYTLRLAKFGDANLDGTINADDYALIDRGYAKGATNWTEGDFNYDGIIDQGDYLLIDKGFALQTGQLSPALLAAREGQFGVGYISELVASVPEPSALGIIALGSLGLRRRRR